ncbi:hypothetical protein VTO73DRAFT_3446 [Trametes versicolor]
MTQGSIPFTVFALERSRLPAHSAGSYKTSENILYDVPIAPRIPLHIGLLVRIAAILPAHPQALPAAGESGGGSTYYTATETEIVGRVVGVRTMERLTTELVVKNENAATAAAYAYLTIHHEEGKTVHLPLWIRTARAVFRRGLANTRDVPIEQDAVVRFRQSHNQLGEHTNCPAAVVPTAEEWMDE